STPLTCSCTPGICPGPPVRTTGWTPASVLSSSAGWSRWSRFSAPPASTVPGSRSPAMPIPRPDCWVSSAGTLSGGGIEPTDLAGGGRGREPLGERDDEAAELVRSLDDERPVDRG